MPLSSYTISSAGLLSGRCVSWLSTTDRPPLSHLQQAAQWCSLSCTAFPLGACTTIVQQRGRHPLEQHAIVGSAVVCDPACNDRRWQLDGHTHQTTLLVAGRHAGTPCQRRAVAPRAWLAPGQRPAQATAAAAAESISRRLAWVRKPCICACAYTLRATHCPPGPVMPVRCHPRPW